MEDLISVIIPVYNSERYLGCCIQSIQEQTYSHFEVLLLDDGSADSSRDICERICETDKRFIYFPLTHRGVSYTRNEGMRKAKGKYLFFLDSDDEIHPNLLEILHRLIKKWNTVAAGAGYSPAGEGKGADIRMKKGDTIRYTCLKNKEALACFPFEMRDYFFFSIGGKMILRDAVSTLKFHTDLSNGEDTLFLYQVFSNGADAVVLHGKWYYYKKREDGASEAGSVRSYQDRYSVCRYIYEQEKRKGRISNAVNWEDFIIRFILSGRLKNYDTGREDLEKYFIHIMMEQKERELFSYVRCGTRVRFYLARFCFPLYRRLFLLALIFTERRNKEAELLPKKYMERQIEEVYLQP